MRIEEQTESSTNTTSDRGEMGCEGVNEIILAWDRDVSNISDHVNRPRK